MQDGVLRICWWGTFIPLHGPYLTSTENIERTRSAIYVQFVWCR